jgi:regulatory protein
MAENIFYNSALSRAMNLCAEREWCLSDMRQKLITLKVKESDIEKIITSLVQNKFVDEARYASAFAKDRFRYNKWGRIKIGSALRLKRIPEEFIRKGLDEINEVEYLELLKKIIEKHRKNIRAKNQYDLKGKLLRHCLSKGFESNLVYDQLNLEE